MKKLLIVVLSLGLLSLQAYAVDLADFSFVDESGTVQYNYQLYYAAVAAEKVAAAGLDLDVDSYWVTDWLGTTFFDTEAFERDYEAAMALRNSESVVEDPVEEPEDLPPSDPEPEVNEYDDDPSSSYPVGSYVDEAGNVYSADGELLSPGTTPAAEPDVGSSLLDPLPDGEDQTSDFETEYVPAVYTVSDLRSGDGGVYSVVSGLKALIISIFGEYTPVMTTMAVTETVDNVTTTTLVDAVAPGAAGVDYEWLSGVALFAILLFCALKLLGGVLK